MVLMQMVTVRKSNTAKR